MNEKVYLTSDIISKLKNNRNKDLAFKSNIQSSIESIKAKSSLLGTQITKLNKELYALTNEKSILIVSMKQIALPFSCCMMFQSSKFNSVSFNDIDSSEVEYTTEMFDSAQINKLDLSNFKTSKVENMRKMFYSSEINDINLSSFDTRMVKTMEQMFSACMINELDLSSFDVSNVRNMSGMFYGSYIETLNIESFNIGNKVDTHKMFRATTANLIKTNNKKIISIINEQRIKL